MSPLYVCFLGVVCLPGGLEEQFQAGNMVTGEIVEELILAGADIIKVGIGPGNVIINLSSHLLSFWCLGIDWYF